MLEASVLKAAAEGAIRGGGSMAALRAFFSLLGAVFSGKIVKKPMEALKELLTEDGRLQTLFAGLFVGVYSGVRKALRNRRAQQRTKGGVSASNDAAANAATDGNDAALAAFVAGLTIAFDKGSRRETLSLYMASRAAGVLIRAAAARGIVPTVPNFGFWIFTLCQVPNMSAFMFEEELIDPDYRRLIYKWSRDMSHEQLDHCFRNIPHYDRFVPCEAAGFHEGPCVPYLAKDMFLNWLATAKMYVPIYTIPLLMWKREKLATAPFPTLTRYFQSIFNSGMLLGTYIFFMKGTMCSYRHLEQRNGFKGGRMHWSAGVVGGALTGTGVLWEPEGRRQELAIYVLPQTLIVIWNKLKQYGLAKTIPGFNSIIFATAMAVFMKWHSKYPEQLKPWMRGMLGKVIEGPHAKPRTPTVGRERPGGAVEKETDTVKRS